MADLLWPIVLGRRQVTSASSSGRARSTRNLIVAALPAASGEHRSDDGSLSDGGASRRDAPPTEPAAAGGLSVDRGPGARSGVPRRNVRVSIQECAGDVVDGPDHDLKGMVSTETSSARS